MLGGLLGTKCRNSHPSGFIKQVAPVYPKRLRLASSYCLQHGATTGIGKGCAEIGVALKIARYSGKPLPCIPAVVMQKAFQRPNRTENPGSAVKTLCV